MGRKDDREGFWLTNIRKATIFLACGTPLKPFLADWLGHCT